MAPNHGYLIQDEMGEPVSRTYQYRKVMKPLLERRRRARINRCLDELKELMTGTLQNEGENVAKLEKADILELTVRHLQGLRRHNQLATSRKHSKSAAAAKSAPSLAPPPQPPPSSSPLPSASSASSTSSALSASSYVDRFRAGFKHCAVEVTQFLGTVDQSTSSLLVKHLTGCMGRLDVLPPSAATKTEAAVAGRDNCDQHTDLPPLSPAHSPPINVEDVPVWRPW